MDYPFQQHKGKKLNHLSGIELLVARELFSFVCPPSYVLDFVTLEPLSITQKIIIKKEIMLMQPNTAKLVTKQSTILSYMQKSRSR